MFAYAVCGKEEMKMQEISREYVILFNAITQAENDLSRLREDLIRAQQLAEETYICRPPEIVPSD